MRRRPERTITGSTSYQRSQYPSYSSPAASSRQSAYPYSEQHPAYQDRSRSGYRTSYRDGYQQDRYEGDYRTAAGSGFGPGNGRPGQSGARAGRPRHPGRVTAKILLVVLLVIAVAIAGVFIWSNNQLTHMNALTDATDDSARTWLILGSDARDGTIPGQTSAEIPGERTDTIMLLVSPQHGPAALISIPRDSYVEYQGEGMKINAVAEEKGWPALTSVVERMSGLKVDHVVKVGFAGVKNVVDAVGGVSLCYDRTVSDPYSGLNWQAGCHVADGTTALAFSRMRHGDPLGDLGRAQRQRMVIQAVAKKVMTPSFLFSSRMPGTLKAGLKAVTVDEQSSPLTLGQMALAFRSATSSGGITGMPVLTSMGTYIDGLGSCVTIDRAETLSLFQKIKDGTQAAGVVGGLPDS